MAGMAAQFEHPNHRLNGGGFLYPLILAKAWLYAIISMPVLLVATLERAGRNRI
jgi:hypothetical protein